MQTMISKHKNHEIDLKNYKIVGVDPGVSVVTAACVNANERTKFYSREEYKHVFLINWSQKVSVQKESEWKS